MKRQLMTGLFAALAFTAVAQSNEWRDPEVNAVNRAPMHANFFAYETAEVAANIKRITKLRIDKTVARISEKVI